MRLINADNEDLMQSITTSADTYLALRKFLQDAPTVDAVPVVRCGECKYNNACLTQSFVEDNGIIPFDRDTFFCADGERNTNYESKT